MGRCNSYGLRLQRNQENNRAKARPSTSQTIMKTTCLALGLLLLTVFHSYATPLGLQAAPETCCFSFLKMRVPYNKIVSIQKTHIGCPLPGFVVKTVQRKLICFQSSERWVQKAFNLLK
ncbi:C-C motif chemokine 8-like [Salmo salar]|uniref:C-C motif chemokine 8-like n=1 Tax=Salmo salar TaxID=8030 RepID=A0ABM3CC05_SALSA|nr:C-C motif chemokine 8-like [Salmo salar]